MADVPSATSEETFRPARHAQDDWLDEIPGVHRYRVRLHTPDGLALAMQFAGNYYNTNEATYGLKDSDLAVLIIARHHATAFGYKDAHLGQVWQAAFASRRNLPIRRPRRRRPSICTRRRATGKPGSRAAWMG